MRSPCLTVLALVLGVSAMGCAREAVAPSQRGIRYDPHDGGVKPEVLAPGSYSLGWCVLRDCGYIETYDVTYQARKESVYTPSSEGLAMDVKVTVMYRPVVSELYKLHTEIGKDYYETLLGPEARSAARNVLARHSYTNLVGQLDKVEDEIEEEVKRRIHGKHIEVVSITLEQIKYASPEIASAVEKRLVGQQEAARQKAALEAQAAREKQKVELAAAQAKIKAETEANTTRLQNEIAAEKQKREADLAAEKSKRDAELALLTAKNQKEVLKTQLEIDKLEAQQKVVRAQASAQERTLLASAKAAENRAAAAAHTSYTVQAAGYDALGKLGGTGTTIFLGDWSRAPTFLWPRQYLTPPAMNTPVAPAAAKPLARSTTAAAATKTADLKPLQTWSASTGTGY